MALQHDLPFMQPSARNSGASFSPLPVCCPFARSVWMKINSWSGGLVEVPEQQVDVEARWASALENLSKQTRRTKAALLMYTAWNIWKERNRHIFEGQCMDAAQVEHEIKAEIMLRKMACGGPEVT
ncbi:hypothetical protein BAE44_0020456 [Dichanthelium oligosanthes]|uniref:Uncharacterized protein n=1 Tax=Dichanthelium oligosanthes TaxID=888268 RepID=A0A1E5V0J7_9POAL|nr:hypothetical protein BAE44_0020456 [Dichanthelium oligosanthes]